MCGIAGIFLKDSALEPELGALLAGMLTPLSDRGPDSAGFAVYGELIPSHVKLTLRAKDGFDLQRLLGTTSLKVSPELHDTHAVITVPAELQSAVVAQVANVPEVSIVGIGKRMSMFKEVGRPEKVAARFGLDRMTGTHAIGHTRMATELAVTTDGAHPFTTGPDQCLVHNGSLSNHNTVRRELQRNGLKFQTDNDFEVAAGFLTWKMREGASLGQAMEASLAALDGFYTFVIGTENGFGVLRDRSHVNLLSWRKPLLRCFWNRISCAWGLPGIAGARVLEPDPAKVYFWER